MVTGNTLHTCCGVASSMQINMLSKAQALSVLFTLLTKVNKAVRLRTTFKIVRTVMKMSSLTQ